MKRMVMLLATVAVLTAGYLMPGPASAASANMEVTAGIGLNVRSGPGLEYKVLTAMPYGTVVSTGQWSGVWVQVTYQGVNGWSDSDWLKNVDSVPTSTTTASASTGQSSVASGSPCVWVRSGNACAPAWIANAIYSAAARYGVSGTRLMKVAACESGFNTGAVGAEGEIGVFQFKWGTYYGNGGQGDIWNVTNQANVAAKMFAEGLSYEWTCARWY